MAARKSYSTDHADAVVRELENIRERLDYSQQRMADALDVPFRTYQKWVSCQQKPHHGSALLGRARELMLPRRANCWEVLDCGREPGGDRVDQAGPCPAAIDRSAHGVNSGANGGRVCWAISGTFCGMQVEGSEAARLVSCFGCDFFKQVVTEEGLAYFKLLKPGQSFTQS